MVNQSEVTIKIGENSTCNITSYSSTAISCVPPQSGTGTVSIVVSFAYKTVVQLTICYVCMQYKTFVFH